MAYPGVYAERLQMMQRVEVRCEAGQVWIGLDGVWHQAISVGDGISLEDGNVILSPPMWLLYSVDSALRDRV